MKHLTKSLAIVFAMSVPALASADVELSELTENEVRVTYNSDDATTTYGRIELERKIKRAAEAVCGSRNLQLAGSIGQVIKNRNCYEKAIADAMNTVKASA